MDREDSAATLRSGPGRKSGCRMTTVVLLLILVSIPLRIFHRITQEHWLRGQVSEGASLADSLRPVIAAGYASNHTFPTDNRQAGVAEPGAISGRFVSSVAIANGTITATYGNRADVRIAGRKIVFLPHPDGDKVAWSCNSRAGSTVDFEYLPSFCR